MSDAITALVNASTVAKGKQSYFKKLSHMAMKEKEHLDKAAKYGSCLTAGLMAIADGNVEQARVVDSVFTITPAGRVKLTDRKSFDHATPMQLGQFLAICNEAQPVKSKQRVDLQIVDLTESDEPVVPPTKKHRALLDRQ